MSDKRILVIRLAGAAMLVIGAIFTAWLAYCLFVDPRPEVVEATRARTPGAAKGMVLTAVLAYVGAGMAFGRRDGSEERSATPPSLTHEQHAEILALVERGRNIDAIKCYRHVTGVGLAEAKSYVEQFNRAA